MMNTEKFRELLATYGTNFSNWEQERDEAENFLSSSAEAKTVFDEAEKFEAELDKFTVEVPELSLRRKIINAIESDELKTNSNKETGKVVSFISRRKMPTLSFWPAFSSAAIAAAVFGFMVLSGNEVVTPPFSKSGEEVATIKEPEKPLEIAQIQQEEKPVLPEVAQEPKQQEQVLTEEVASNNAKPLVEAEAEYDEVAILAEIAAQEQAESNNEAEPNEEELLYAMMKEEQLEKEILGML